jgi:hypothetical protein
MAGAAHSSAATARSRTLGRENHLQEFVRVFEEVSELIALRSQYFAGQLRGDLDPGHRRIFCHVSDFIHFDAGISCGRGLELFGQRGRLCVSAGRRADEARELRLSQSRREVDAGDSGGGEQLRETSFAGRRPQRHAIEQDLIARSAEKHAAPPAILQRLAQFLPCGFKLLRRFHVAELVQPRKFQQNVEAADKGSRPALRVRTHARRTGIPAFPSIFLRLLQGEFDAEKIRRATGLRSWRMRARTTRLTIYRESVGVSSFSSTLVFPPCGDKPRCTSCIHLNNRFVADLGTFLTVSVFHRLVQLRVRNHLHSEDGGARIVSAA